MRIFKYRLKKEYRLKVWAILISVFIIGYLFIPRSNRLMVFAFFNSKCKNYLQSNYSKKLNDRLVDYSASAALSGIKPAKNEAAINKLVRQWKLVRVRTSSLYIIADLRSSYPYATRDSRRLLREIGRRFEKEIKKYGLKGSRFFVTSMTRTSESMSGLKKVNGNVSDNSPHLNGNAFDISYAHFSFRKLYVTSCDEWYLKEALAQVIWELKSEKQCWATYEKTQGCFHVVAR